MRLILRHHALFNSIQEHIYVYVMIGFGNIVQVMNVSYYLNPWNERDSQTKQFPNLNMLHTCDDDRITHKEHVYHV